MLFEEGQHAARLRERRARRAERRRNARPDPAGVALGKGERSGPEVDRGSRSSRILGGGGGAQPCDRDRQHDRLLRRDRARRRQLAGLAGGQGELLLLAGVPRVVPRHRRGVRDERQALPRRGGVHPRLRARPRRPAQPAGPGVLPAAAALDAYTDVFRGIPTILLIYMLGFGVPALALEGVPTSEFFWGVVALVLVYSAYVAEVYRAGIESITRARRPPHARSG